MIVVSDTSANADEKIERAARVLRSSKQNMDVFRAIYSGGRSKTIEDIRASVSHFNINTYKAAARLHGEDIVDRKHEGGVMYYSKKDFYKQHRDRILRLAKNLTRLKAYPTKRRQARTAVKSYTFSSKPQAEQLTIDDIDSFKAVHSIRSADTSGLKNMPERTVNRAICRIVNQTEKKDWGGERNDIFTNNIVFKGKRKSAAFALKGKATKGILTLKKMGSKDDQVQRLFEGTAEIHFVAHHSDIDERVQDQMQIQALGKSVIPGKKIY